MTERLSVTESLRRPSRATLVNERGGLCSSYPPPSSVFPPSGEGDLKTKLQRYEAQLILDALRSTRWNQTEAARALGMPLRTLVHKIKAFDIKKLDR